MILTLFKEFKKANKSYVLRLLGCSHPEKCLIGQNECVQDEANISVRFQGRENL